MRTKLEEGRYEGAEDVARDVRLIWSNCILYNSPGSEFGQLAAGLAKKFEERYSKIKVWHPRTYPLHMYEGMVVRTAGISWRCLQCKVCLGKEVVKRLG